MRKRPFNKVRDFKEECMSEINKKDLDLIADILRKREKSEDHYRSFIEQGRENYLLYRSYKEGGEKVYTHDIFVPYSYALMEDRAAYFMLSVTASPAPFELEPRMAGISRQLCQELEQIIGFLLDNPEAEFALELEDLIKSIGIYNVGYLVNYEMLGENGRLSQYRFDTPPPHTMWPQPGAKRLSRSNWIIKQSWESWESFERAAKDGTYSNIEDAKAGSARTEDDPVRKYLASVGLGDVITPKGSENDVELLDYFADSNVITVANRRAVVRNTTKDPINPYSYAYPVLDCRFSGAPFEWMGIDLIESFKPLQKDLNVLRSQRRENVSLALNKLFFYDITRGEIDLSTLFSGPGNVIIGQNRDALDLIDIPNVTSQSYQEEENIKYDIQNVTSLWEYARGGTPRRRETASGIIRLQQAAQSRNEWLLRKLDLYILQPLCRRLMYAIFMYMPQTDYVNIIGRNNKASEFYGMDPDVIRESFTVKPLTESLQSVKEVNVNQFIQAFERLIGLPPEFGINHQGLVKQLLTMLGIKNIKDILPGMKPEAQDATMQAIAQAQQGPPPPPGMPNPLAGVQL
jgi:hypothetical protein